MCVFVVCALSPIKRNPGKKILYLNLRSYGKMLIKIEQYTRKRLMCSLCITHPRMGNPRMKIIIINFLPVNSILIISFAEKSIYLVAHRSELLGINGLNGSGQGRSVVYEST